MRDHYEGVESDDETDSDSAGEGGAESDEEDQPQVVGDVEDDMAEEEDDFLDFARGALGEWAGFVRERRARGGFVPTSTSKKTTSSSTSPCDAARGRRAGSSSLEGSRRKSEGDKGVWSSSE
ncbi:unnamed protein product [Peniophora sp. CBMAI 1063]|nr:unnamed protein product [Peniophora sp. CBMAI 1063]